MSLKYKYKKLQKYWVLLYFCCIGVPFYAQEASFSLSDNLSYWQQADTLREEDAFVQVEEQGEYEYDTNEDSLALRIPPSKAPVSVTSLGDLSKKYNSEDFDYQMDDVDKGEGFLEGLWYALRRILEKIFEFIYGKDRGGLGLSDLYQYLGIGLLLVAVFFIVRWVLKGKGRGLFARKKEKITGLSFEEVEKHLHQVDFSQLIQQAEKQNNTRQSIRLHYLWLLRVLSEKNKIEWQHRKTNTDYLRELKDEEQRTRFAYLSKVYDYIWYGEFSINDIEYQQAKREFSQYINTQNK